jgi:hypothetical protein
MLNWPRSAMGKLKSVEELFEGRHFDREIIRYFTSVCTDAFILGVAGILPASFQQGS